MRKLGFVSLVMGLFLASGVGATPIDSVDLGGHKIELLSMNVFDGEFYVWTYKVSSGEGPSLSHWVLDFCIEFFDDANEVWADHTESADPSSGLFGIKFDEEYRDLEMREVEIYLTKAVVGVDTTVVGTKAGSNQVFVGTILAPGCECVEEGIPEPTTMALLAAGMLGLTAKRRRLL